jgi:hypothetical protein
VMIYAALMDSQQPFFKFSQVLGTVTGGHGDKCAIPYIEGLSKWAFAIILFSHAKGPPFASP